MKRNKHILINLTEEQYNQLLFIATNQRRKLSDAAYLILIDEIDRIILETTDIKTVITQPVFSEDH